MSGFSDYSGRKVLDLLTGKTAFALPVAYMALFTVAPADSGGGTEVTGNNYARVATIGANWNAAAGSAPCSASNAQDLTFPQATPAGWGTIVAFGAYDALTVGNLLWWDYLGNYAWSPVTVSLASPGVFTQPAHGYANGDSVLFTTEYGGTAPGLSAGSLAGILTVANVTADTYTVQSTGAVNVNTSSTGNGMVRKLASQAVNAGNTALFTGGTPGALVITGA